MDLLNHGFEVHTELPRELNTSELLGRRLYVDLKNRFPKIDTIGEPQDWSNYVIFLGPYRVSFEHFNWQPGIRYCYSKDTNLLKITYTDNALPIESRTLTQHLLKEIYKWQKKKKLKQ
jgi:hypothetical protein